MFIWIFKSIFNTFGGVGSQLKGSELKLTLKNSVIVFGYAALTKKTSSIVLLFLWILEWRYLILMYMGFLPRRLPYYYFSFYTSAYGWVLWSRHNSSFFDFLGIIITVLPRMVSNKQGSFKGKLKSRSRIFPMESNYFATVFWHSLSPESRLPIIHKLFRGNFYFCGPFIWGVEIFLAVIHSCCHRSESGVLLQIGCSLNWGLQCIAPIMKQTLGTLATMQKQRTKRQSTIHKTLYWGHLFLHLTKFSSGMLSCHMVPL